MEFQKYVLSKKRKKKEKKRKKIKKDKVIVYRILHKY